MKNAKDVDEFLAGNPAWRPTLEKLRKILLSTGLEETVKWGAPCYTWNGKNVVGIVAFAQSCALWFHQGVFLSDPEGVLVNANEERTRAQRQWRFQGPRDVVVAKVKAYVREAIANEEAGKRIRPERGKPLVVPPELAAALRRRPATRVAFEKLGLGKQREYAEYIAEAKRSATKATRLERILPLIEAGAGLNDRYR